MLRPHQSIRAYSLFLSQHMTGADECVHPERRGVIRMANARAQKAHRTRAKSATTCGVDTTRMPTLAQANLMAAGLVRHKSFVGRHQP